MSSNISLGNNSNGSESIYAANYQLQQQQQQQQQQQVYKVLPVSVIVGILALILVVNFVGKLIFFPSMLRICRYFCNL